MSSPRTELPSHAELLRDGGLYPIPVPLGWKLIGSNGEDIAIPVVENGPFHRILARGALLATEAHPGQPPEAMTLRMFALSGPPSQPILDDYSRLVNDAASRQGLHPRIVSKQIIPSALSSEPCAKLVIEQGGTTDRRLEIRYLVRDRAGSTWELAYVLRADNAVAWSPLLAEIESGQAVP